MKQFSKLLAVMLCVTMLLAACGGSDAGGTVPGGEGAGAGTSTGGSGGGNVVSYTLGSSGTSGAQYIIGAAMASEINKASETVNIAVQSTSGASENIMLVNGGEMDFGWGNTDTLYNYVNGLEYVDPRDQTENIVGVMALQPTFGQFMVRKAAGIESIEDLRGKRVSLGTTSASVYYQSRTILEYYGIDPDKDLASAELLSQDEATGKLSDGDIDAMFIMAAIPTAAYTNLTIDDKYAMIDIDPDDLQAIVDSVLTANEVGIIPADTYPNIDYDVHALYSRSAVFCRVDLPDEVVYEFCKQVYDNWEAIQIGHAILPTLNTDEFPHVGIDLHPGARRYYEEHGLL